MSEPDCLLVSVSARALAASAARAGLAPLVIDLFTDLDTREAAADTRCARGGEGLVFETDSLLAAADELDPQGRAPVVWGSGFDAAPHALERLAARRLLLGCPPEAIRRLKDPRALATLLADLGIPRPETRDTPPDAPAGWLLKRAGAAGGAHVRAADAGDVPAHPRDYWQRRVTGLAASATVLADGREAVVLGHTEQLFESLGPARPFLYGGGLALAADALPARLRGEIAEAARALTRGCGLRGLWGMDFVIENERWWLLEVNPRPGASFELHEHGRSLFALHLAACRGSLPAVEPVPADAPQHAQRIVYAPAPVRAPALGRWPTWISDRPVPGTAIGTGEPVCSVHAHARGAMALRVALGRRVSEMLTCMAGWREAVA